MQLIALKAFKYGRRNLKAGDTFDTETRSDGRVLIAARHARSAEEPSAPAARKRTYKHRAAKAGERAVLSAER